MKKMAKIGEIPKKSHDRNSAENILFGATDNLLKIKMGQNAPKLPFFIFYFFLFMSYNFAYTFATGGDACGYAARDH